MGNTLISPMYIEPRQGKKHFPLDGEWDFAWTDSLCEQPDEIRWEHKTQVPRSVYWSLYEAGILPHPYEKCNSKQYAWVDEKVWYYRKTFFLPGPYRTDRSFLCVDGAAYYTRVWVNGHCLGDHAGMFGGPVAEIQSFLRFGEENTIVLAVRSCDYGGDLPPYRFKSPENQAIVPWNVVRDGHTSNGDFTVLGLWRPVRIEFLSRAHLARPYLTTESVTDGAARLHLQVELVQPELPELTPPKDYEEDIYQGYTFAYSSGLADAFRRESVQIAVELREKETGRLACAKTEEINLLDYDRLRYDPDQWEANFIDMDLPLDRVRLWNPVGLGDPFLYSVTIALLQNGGELDRLQFDYGVRTLKLARTAGKRYRARWDSFQFVVNGRRFFLKGVDWMPVDFLYREEEKEYRWILEAVRDAGIQLIRVWSGGGYPESDIFYRLCDELGILVWQDNFIANMDTPNWPQDVLQEQVRLNLYRIRNHPSLALHCGGNEFNPYSFGNASSMFVIERNIRDLDPSRPFKRTTPDMGSAHIYRDMEPTWYRHCYGQLPFVAESGIHSFPNAKSLRQLISAGEFARPVDNMMDDSFRRTHPELLNHFTEYVPERIPRMLARASAITDISSAGVEELAEATQMASAEFYQIMIQSMRENYPVTGGMMLWVLKRSWTTVGIQLVDGLGDPIPPYYYVKSAYAPVSAVISLPHLIYAAGEDVPLALSVINESGRRLSDATVCLEVYSSRLETVCHREYEVTIGKDQYRTPIAEESFSLPESFRERFFILRASIYQGGALLQQSVYWPKCLRRMEDEAFRESYRAAPHENLVFDKGPWLKESIQEAPKAVLRCESKTLFAGRADGRSRFLLRMTNRSDVPAFPVRLQVGNDGCVQNVSDNDFFLPPGESRELRLDILDRSGRNQSYELGISAWNALPLALML